MASRTINVTPMIDVLLVLLIIFMVIVPELPPREKLRWRPQPAAKHGRAETGAVVLEVLKGSGRGGGFQD